MPLVVASSITVFLSIAFFCLDKKTKFGNLNPFLKQTIIGIFFGLSACYASNFGSVSVNGAALNARDAAPLSAGLLFGPWAGILSGLIGALNRYFITTPVYGIGEYTQLACSIATLFAGIFAGCLRVFLFKKHRPLVIHAIVATIFVEAIHMSLVPLTNMEDLEQAVIVVVSCFFPLVLSNVVAVALSVVITSIMNQKFNGYSFKEMFTEKDLLFSNDLYYSFQFWLLVIIVVAFSLNVFATNFMYEKAASQSIQEETYYEMEDVKNIILGHMEAHPEADLQDIVSILESWSEVTQECYFLIDENGKSLTNNDTCNKIAENINDFQPLELNTLKVGNDTLLVMYDNARSYKLVEYSYLKYKMFIPFLTNSTSVFAQIIIFSFLMVGIFILLKKLVSDQLDSVNNSLSKITEGDLEEKVDVYTNNEFCVLSDSINTTVDALKHYIELEANRYSKDLSLAKQIQLSAIPKEFPPFPDHPEVDIFATYKAAKEVGGDFYDYYFLDNERLAFVIADVSGKGIPAALFMMRAKMALRMFADKYKDTAKTLYYVNNYLCDENSAEMFVTAWFGILNIKTGKLQVSNAGHNPPVLINYKDTHYQKIKANLVLGGISDVKYDKSYITLNKNDYLFLYTDGITEANNADHELYGEERLLSLLKVCKKDAFSTCMAVVDDLASFTKGEEQSDDMTTLCLNFKGEDE